MAGELVNPVGMDFSPVAPASGSAAGQQTAWDLDAGGSYSGQFHSDSTHTSAQAAAEAHVGGDAWGHSFHGEVDGNAGVSHDASGFSGHEHINGHVAVHDAFAHSGHDSASHSAHDSHSHHDSGSHSSHGSDPGSHGGDHGGGHGGGL